MSPHILQLVFRKVAFGHKFGLRPQACGTCPLMYRGQALPTPPGVGGRLVPRHPDTVLFVHATVCCNHVDGPVWTCPTSRREAFRNSTRRVQSLGNPTTNLGWPPAWTNSRYSWLVTSFLANSNGANSTWSRWSNQKTHRIWHPFEHTASLALLFLGWQNEFVAPLQDVIRVCQVVCSSPRSQLQLKVGVWETNIVTV